MAALDESTVETMTLGWFAELGYVVAHGAGFMPDGENSERAALTDVVLEQRLRAAVARLNPALPESAREDAVLRLLRSDGLSLERSNRAFHTLLRDGVPVEYARPGGGIAGNLARLIDFDDVDANDWLVVQQFVVRQGAQNRRPDLLVFLNGLPLAILELKNAAGENTTIWSAFDQLRTYKNDLPALMRFNEAMVISDGLQARIGSLTANREWFKVWRTIEGESEAPKDMLELEVLVRGVFEKSRFLALLQHFITFDEDADSGRVVKVLAGYHQFHAVNAAVHETVRAAAMPATTLAEDKGTYWAGGMREGKPGDRRAGVVWHTQGSGKSLSMLFYGARIIQHPALQNPTLVVLTDRNDLDDQLFGQFLRCQDLLRQTPVQASSRDHLRALLQVASGGVVFTTIQKFLPERGERMPALSTRRNIVVIADEAHRSQYDLIDGFARHMRDALPGATFIGFTGTPIEKADANTRAVFGDYISIYDIQRAVADKATVPIYYENRIARLGLNEAALPAIDEEFEALTEGEEESSRQKLKTKWAAVEALVGDPKRIALVAQDLVTHFERRLEVMDGKAMVVCMSRRIAVDLYDAIVRLRPEWASAPGDDIAAEQNRRIVVKVVMTGSAADGPEWQPHIRSGEGRRQMAVRFKDPSDPFRIVIVRDMWLTGFDVPCLHTMYLDKPMRGHGLMQAIARVNRVFRDKPGGLIVDYLGLAEQLAHALAVYTESGGRGSPTRDAADAFAVLSEKHEVLCAMMHGFEWQGLVTNPTAMLRAIPAAQEHVLRQEDGKRRFVRTATELSRAFALCATTDAAMALRDDIAFFQAVRAALLKNVGDARRSPEEIDAAVRQLVSSAITATEGIVDVFSAAGMQRPDISILDDRFLLDVRRLQHKHVAAEMLADLLRGEIRKQSERNVVLSQRFSEKLRQALNAYHNHALSAQEIIEQLIALAKELRGEEQRHTELGLAPDETAFYDALAANESAVEVLGNEQLKIIAVELIRSVRGSVTIDWQFKEGARARIRVVVKKILRRFGYPPDLQDDAVKLVLAQAEVLCEGWTM